MLKKRFHWSDLRKMVKDLEGKPSRRAMALSMILEGHKVDLSKIPTRVGYRQPGDVRYQLKRIFAVHDGIVNDGLIYWIPELYGKD